MNKMNRVGSTNYKNKTDKIEKIIDKFKLSFDYYKRYKSALEYLDTLRKEFESAKASSDYRRIAKIRDTLIKSIYRLQNLKTQSDVTIMGYKIFMNSASYGVTGNRAYFFYDPDVSESVTIAGKKLITNTIKHFNDYPKYLVKVLNEVGINVKLKDTSEQQNKQTDRQQDDIIMYADTDSVMLSIHDIFNRIDWSGYEYLLKDKGFLDFVRDDILNFIHNVIFTRIYQNDEDISLLRFEYEGSYRNFLIKTKKVYMAWNNKDDYKIRGFEVTKTGTYSNKVREKLLEFIKHFIFDVGILDDFYLYKNDVMAWLNNMVDVVKGWSIIDTSKHVKMKTFTKYVEEDFLNKKITEFAIKKGASSYVKGYAFFYWLIINNYNKDIDILEDTETRYTYIRPYYIDDKQYVNTITFNISQIELMDKLINDGVIQLDYPIIVYELFAKPINRIIEILYPGQIIYDPEQKSFVYAEDPELKSIKSKFNKYKKKDIQ